MSSFRYCEECSRKPVNYKTGERICIWCVGKELADICDGCCNRHYPLCAGCKTPLPHSSFVEKGMCIADKVCTVCTERLVREAIQRCIRPPTKERKYRKEKCPGCGGYGYTTLGQTCCYDCMHKDDSDRQGY